MDLDKYIADKQKEFKDLTIKTSVLVNSGVLLGLNQSQLDKYLDLELSEFEREIVKISLFLGIEADLIDKLISVIRTTETDSIEKTAARCIIELLAPEPEAAAELGENLEEAYMEEPQVEQEVPKFEPEAPSDQKQQKLGPSTKPGFKFFKKKCVKPEETAYRKKELPEGFLLSEYLVENSKNLSSSQMDLIRYACQLGISKTLIYNLIESHADAQHMKQIIECSIADQEYKETQIRSQDANKEIPVDPDKRPADNK